jgi:asparagine synthetase B (glutamine-hydrolysing)
MKEKLLKKLLENHIENNVPDESVAILLSGGIDSITVGLASENAGKKVHAYSFYLDGSPSYDFVKAAEVAHKKNWHFTPIVVPRNNLIKDWHRLVELKCRKKTHFECVFPFLYVYPKIKETYVFTGWGADGYFGVSKKAMMRYSNLKKWDNYTEYCKENNQKQLTFDEFRNEYLNGDCAGLKEHTNLATKHNKVHITPYLDADVRQLLMGMDWKELNKPRQKEIVRKDFTELKKFGIIKSHQNLHLGAGIQYLFETLLDNKDINFKDRKRMMDVCRDWYEKERHGILPI